MPYKSLYNCNYMNIFPLISWHGHGQYFLSEIQKPKVYSVVPARSAAYVDYHVELHITHLVIRSEDATATRPKWAKEQPLYHMYTGTISTGWYGPVNS